MTRMQAAVCLRYGPPEVLVIRQVEKPWPKADEVLVQIHASTVNSSDWFIRSGMPIAPVLTRLMMRLTLGLRGPRRQILGLIVAGEVVEVGAAVTRFHLGDRVWAFTKFHLGGYAEYTCLREGSTVGPAPTGLPYDDIAAIVFGGLLALHYVRKGGVTPGMKVLLYGASSGVGTAAIQLAKHFGAEVTAVCGPQNVELVRSLGADHVLDYTTASTPPAGARYDLVLDTVGKRKTSALRTACEHALGPQGRVLSVDDGTPAFSAHELAALKDLVECGAIKPVIDRRYPLAQIVEAHRYVEQEHKKGNVVITITPTRPSVTGCASSGRLMPMALFMGSDWPHRRSWVNTRFSVLPVMVLHWSINTWRAVLPIIPNGGSVRPHVLAKSILFVIAIIVVLKPGPKTAAP